MNRLLAPMLLLLVVSSCQQTQTPKNAEPMGSDSGPRMSTGSDSGPGNAIDAQGNNAFLDTGVRNFTVRPSQCDGVDTACNWDLDCTGREACVDGDCASYTGMTNGRPHLDASDFDASCVTDADCVMVPMVGCRGCGHCVPINFAEVEFYNQAVADLPCCPDPGCWNADRVRCDDAYCFEGECYIDTGS